MSKYVVRHSTQLGVGLDPYIDKPGRAIGRKWQRYYRGGGIWQGGPETACKFDTVKDADRAIWVNGNRKPMGSDWLGHVGACEIVTFEQAMEDEDEP